MDNNLNNSIQHIQGTDIIAKTYSIINENFDLLWSTINSLRPDKESVNNVNVEWLGGDNVGIPGRVYSNINDNDKKYIGTVDTMKYATPSKPGLLSVTDQQIGGNKKFNDGIAISSGENKGITAKIGTKSIEIINVVSNRGGGYTVSLGGSKVTSGVSPIQLVYNANGALVNVIVTGANGTSTSFKPDEYFEHITSGLNQFLLDKESEMMSKLTDSLVNALGVDNIDFIDGFSNNYFKNSTDDELDGCFDENGDLKDVCADNLVENDVSGKYIYNTNHIKFWNTGDDEYSKCINDAYHAGDTLTLKDLRKCYIYTKSTEVNKGDCDLINIEEDDGNKIYICGWVELTADDYPTVVAALLAALDAQSTVDGKQSIFYGRPKTEYGIKYSYGDTWIINDDDICPYEKDSEGHIVNETVNGQEKKKLKKYFEFNSVENKFICYDRTYDRTTEENNVDKKLYDVYESGEKYYIKVGDDYLTKDETLFCDALENDEPYNIDKFNIDHWNSKMMNVGNLNSKLEDIINALTSQSDSTVSIWSLSESPIPNIDKLGLNIVGLNEGDEITKPWTENSDSGDDNDSDHIGDICIISNSYDRQWVFTQSDGLREKVNADYYWKETEVDISTMMSKFINDKFGDKIQPFLDGQLNIFAAKNANDIDTWEHKSGDIVVNVSEDTITVNEYNFKPGSFYMCNYDVKNKKHSGSEHANTTDDETWILLTDYDSIIEKAMENTSLKDIIVNLYNERFDAYNTAYYIKYVTDKLNNLPKDEHYIIVEGSIRYIFDFSDENNGISESFGDKIGNVYSNIKNGVYKIRKVDGWKTIQESISPDIITALVNASQTKESFEGDTNSSNIGEIVVYSYKGGNFNESYRIGDLIYANASTNNAFSNNGIYVCISSKNEEFSKDDWKKLPDDNSSLINLNLTNQKDNVVNYWYGDVEITDSNKGSYKPWSDDEFIYPDEYYIGDFYICTTKRKCWIYGKTLEWTEIKDLKKYPSVKTIIDGMNNSAALDGVKRNFIGRPNKYSAGDTWLVTAADISSPNGCYRVSEGYILKSGEPLGKENDVLISIEGRDTFNISDWVNIDSTKDITSILEQITNLSNQLDNEVTYWYGDVDLVEGGTNGNALSGEHIYKPWSDDNENHIGDIYVNENTKNCYRFEKDGIYKWVLLTEDKYPIALKSLIKAIGAVETADGKVNVYTSIPIKFDGQNYKTFEVQRTYPDGGAIYYDAKKYGIGDMWIVSEGDCTNADFTEGITNLGAEEKSVLICIAEPKSYETDSNIHYKFDFTNWENVSRKINPSEELAEYISKVNALENQIDNKVNYWFGEVDLVEGGVNFSEDSDSDNDSYNGNALSGNNIYKPWGNSSSLDDHVKDIYTYYDKLYPKNSKCYIFEKEGDDVYSWNEFNESFAEVLKKMAVVEETVDGVISVFNGAPTNGNYGFGDLWVVVENDILQDNGELHNDGYYTCEETNQDKNGDNNNNISTHIFSHDSYKINVKQNDILVCCDSDKKSGDTKGFDLSHWQNMRDRASIDGLYNTISSLETQIDNKVNYWFGTTEIKNNNKDNNQGNTLYKPWGNTGDTKLNLYVGDYYVYNGEKCYRFKYNGNYYEWEDVTTESGANSAFIQSLLNSWRTSAALDNVITIYTKCPKNENYKYGDRWIISSDDFDTTNNNGVIGNGVINTTNGYKVDKNEIYYGEGENKTIIGKEGDEVICIQTKNGGFNITDWMNFGTYVARLDEVQAEIENNIKNTITDDYITNILQTVNLDELRNQLDNTISYWFGTKEINDVNKDNNQGNTLHKPWGNGDAENHIGDIYIYKTTKECWKLKKNSSTIEWEKLSNAESEIITRLINLEEVKDNQLNVFWSIPFDKDYSRGDMWYISDSDVYISDSDVRNKTYGGITCYNLENNHIFDNEGNDYGGVGNVLICGADKGEIFSIFDWMTMTKYLYQNTDIDLSDINNQLQNIQNSLTGSDGIVTYYYSIFSPKYGDNNQNQRRPWKTPNIDVNNEACGKSNVTNEDANHNKDVWVHYDVDSGNHTTYEFIVNNGVGTWGETTSNDNTFTIINKIISTYHLDDVQKALADGTRNIFVGSVKDFLDKTESDDNNTGHGFGDIWYFNKSDFKESDTIGKTNTIDGHNGYSIEKIEDGEKVNNSKDFKLNCLYYCNHNNTEGNHKLSKCLNDWINIGDFDKIREEIKDINSTLSRIEENTNIATSLSNLIGDDEKISPIEKIQIKSLWEKIVGQPGKIDFDTEDGIIEINDGSFDITFFGSSKDALDAVVKNNFVFEIDSSNEDAGYVFDNTDNTDKKFVRNDNGIKSNGDKFVIDLLNSLYYLNEFLWGTPGIMNLVEGKLTTTDLNEIKTTIPQYIYTHCGLDGDGNRHKKVLSSLFSTYYSAEQAIYTHISGETYNKADDAYKAAHNAGLTAFEAMGDAVNVGATTIEGGLMLTNLIAMGDPVTKEITGGLSGVKDDRVGLFFGSTYEDAFNSANWDSINSKMNELIDKFDSLSASERAKLGVLEDIVNNGKPEIPVLITKDGYGSNIGGCYLDDRQMLMVPVDNIDGEVTVSKLTVDKDTRTSKDAEASVSPDSFKIKYGNAFINMGIKNNIPYITGVDGKGNIRFNLGGIDDNIAKLEPGKIGGSIYLDLAYGSDAYYDVSEIDDNSLVRCNLPSFKLMDLSGKNDKLYIDEITYKYKIGNYNRYYDFKIVKKNNETVITTTSDSINQYVYNVEKMEYFESGYGEYDSTKGTLTFDEKPQYDEIYVVRSIEKGGKYVCDTNNREIEFNPDEDYYTEIDVNSSNVYEYVSYLSEPFRFNGNKDELVHVGKPPYLTATTDGTCITENNEEINYVPKSGNELQRIVYRRYFPYFGQIECENILSDEDDKTYLYIKEKPNTVIDIDSDNNPYYVYNNIYYNKGDLSLYAPNTYGTLIKIGYDGFNNKMNDAVMDLHVNKRMNSTRFPSIMDASVEVKVHTENDNDENDYKEQTLSYSWEDKKFILYELDGEKKWKELNPEKDEGVISVSIEMFYYVDLDTIKSKIISYGDKLVYGQINDDTSDFVTFIKVGKPEDYGTYDPYQTKRLFKDKNGYYQTWDASTDYSSYGYDVEPIYVKAAGAFFMNDSKNEEEGYDYDEPYYKKNSGENGQILCPYFVVKFETYKDNYHKKRYISILQTPNMNFMGDSNYEYIIDGINGYSMYPYQVDGGRVLFSDEQSSNASCYHTFNANEINIYNDDIKFKFVFGNNNNILLNTTTGDGFNNPYYNYKDEEEFPEECSYEGVIYNHSDLDDYKYSTFDDNKLNDKNKIDISLTVSVGTLSSTKTTSLNIIND